MLVSRKIKIFPLELFLIYQHAVGNSYWSEKG